MWPSVKWFMIMLTWVTPVQHPETGLDQPVYVELRRQEIPRRNKKHCDNTIARLKKGWITAPDYGYALDCQLNPNWKPKGDRK